MRNQRYWPSFRRARLLFNKRDYEAAKRYWSPHYIQHSAHIEPGRDGLFNLIGSAPPTLKYEPGLIRGNRGAVQEQSTDVRNEFPEMSGVA